MDRRTAVVSLAAVAGAGAWFRWVPANNLRVERDVVKGAMPVPLPPMPPGVDVFVNVPIRGGGFVTAGTFSKRGTYEMAGTDTATSFVRRPGQIWRSALLENTIPDMGAHPLIEDTSDGIGSYTQQIADNGVAYTTLKGYLIRSDDAFTTRARVIFGPKRMFENRGAQRLWNSKMAIDQANPDRFVIGCMGGGNLGGAYYSLDGGATAPRRITGIPDPAINSGIPAPILVATDPNNAQRWALSILGSGIWLSADGPDGPYNLSPGGPTDCQDLHYDNFGRLWAVRVAGQVKDPIYSYESGTWRAAPFPYPADVKTVAINPLVKNHIVALGPNMEVYRTTQKGSNIWEWNQFENAIYPSKQPYHCPDRLWQDTTDSFHKGLFPSRAAFNPVTPNRVSVYHGTGTLYFDPPAKYGGVEFWDTTVGIEQVVANGGMSYVGGDHWLFGWDKGAWKFNDFTVPASQHYPENVGFTHCWHMDVSPSTKTVVMLNNSGQSHGYQSAYSVNKGPFKLFPNQHPNSGRLGGCIGAFDDNTFLWVPFNNGRAVYTEDRGETPWKYVDLGGRPMPADGQESGWSFAMYFKKICVVASKETLGRGWLVNYGPGGFEQLRGIWQTDNGPKGPWRKILDGEMPGYHWLFFHHMVMKEVPGHADFLLMSGGPAPDHDEPLMASRDGGKSWKPLVKGPRGVTDFSFGKPKADAKYPVLRMVARVNGIDGVYEVENLDSPVLKLITKNPAGMVTDSLRAISGDMNVYGKWAYGYAGSGWRGSMKNA